MKGDLLWFLQKGLSHIHTNNKFPFYSHFPSVREFKVLYRHGLIIFIIFLSASYVLYHYPHFVEREIEEQGSPGHGKGGGGVGHLDPWPHSACSSPWQCPLTHLFSPISQRPFHVISTDDNFSLPKGLLQCHMTLDLTQVFFFLGRCFDS